METPIRALHFTQEIRDAGSQHNRQSGVMTIFILQTNKGTINRKLQQVIFNHSIVRCHSSFVDNMPGPVQAAVQSKLKASFDPIHLEVINESHLHNVPLNSETHFKVVVVSNKFRDMKLSIDRHRSVNTALAEELSSNGHIHALSIVAKTPEQWESLKSIYTDGNVHISPSPNCRGGDGSLPSRK